MMIRARFHHFLPDGEVHLEILLAVMATAFYNFTLVCISASDELSVILMTSDWSPVATSTLALLKVATVIPVFLQVRVRTQK